MGRQSLGMGAGALGAGVLIPQGRRLRAGAACSVRRITVLVSNDVGTKRAASWAAARIKSCCRTCRRLHGISRTCRRPVVQRTPVRDQPPPVHSDCSPNIQPRCSSMKRFITEFTLPQSTKTDSRAE